MFSPRIAVLIEDISRIKEVIRWHERLRLTVQGAKHPNSLPISKSAVEILTKESPRRLDWQVFDYCAVVSRVYALFEKVICDLASEYLELSCRIYPNYSSLSDKIRTQHRVGTGQILAKWSPVSPSYGHLSEGLIASGLVDGLRGTPYALLPEAFLVDQGNFRTSALLRLFGYLGIDDCLAWLRKDGDLSLFLAANGITETVDSFLDELVQRRNEAAHSNPNSLVSSLVLERYADFTCLVATSLSRLLITQSIKLGISVGKAIKLGDIVHSWSNNTVGFRSCSDQLISQGDILYIGKRRLDTVTIQTLQIEKIQHESIQLSRDSECGIRLDIKTTQGSSVYRWT